MELQIRNKLISMLKHKYPTLDFNNSSQINALVDQVTYLQSYLDEKIEQQFAELFYDSQTEPESIVSLLDLFPYERRYVLPAYGTLYLLFNLSNMNLDPNNINYLKYTINRAKFASRYNNEKTYEIVNTSINTQDTLNVQSLEFSIPIFIYQTNTFTQTIEISNKEYEIFEIKLPNEKYNILFDSFEGTLTNNFGEKIKCYFQKNFIDLYEKLEIEKISDVQQYLIFFSERDKKYYLLSQNFFGKRKMPGTLTLKFKQSLGMDGNVQENELIITDLDMDIEISTKDTIHNKKIYGIDDILTGIVHTAIVNGKSRENVEEWIVNQKSNQTFGKQVTKNDFELWFNTYIHNYFLSIYDYSYSITYDYSYFQNSVMIYIYFYNPISEEKKKELFRIIKQFYQQIVPYGMYVLVKEQKLVTLSLQGSIDYNSNITTKQRILTEISELLNELNIKYKRRELSQFEITLSEIQQEIYKKVQGLNKVSLSLLQDDIDTNNILKVKPNMVITFDINKTINNLSISKT